MATNRLSKGSAGGGAGSRQVTQKPVRYGQAAKGPTPGRVSQLGNLVGDHVTNKGSTGYRGEAGFGPAPHNAGQRLGNEVAASTAAGPGGSRQVFRSGAQGQHGPINPGQPTPARDILSDFGPDYKR
jgi:hypothetical protein